MDLSFKAYIMLFCIMIYGHNKWLKCTHFRELIGGREHTMGG